MSVAKVEEITSASATSFEDAIQKGIDRACKTLDNVEGAWIQEQKIVIRDQKVAEYRVNMKVTFVLREDEAPEAPARVASTRGRRASK